MKRPYLYTALASVLMISAVSACQAPPQNPAQIPGANLASNTASNAKTHYVSFVSQLPTSAFQTKQIQTQANFVKLTITNGTQTIFSSNANNSGFESVTGASINLGAQVPEGSNWVATLGLYSNTGSPPILELKTAFHVPVAGNVPINIQTHLLGAIVEELQHIGSSKLSTALDLNAYQSFVNSLTGFDFNTSTFTRMTTFSPQNPKALSPRMIAQQIHNDTLATVDQTSGQNANPSTFAQLPLIQGEYRAVSGTYGIDQVMAINPTTGNVFFNESNDQVNERLYGLSTTVPGPNQVTFSELFAPAVKADIQNRYLSLGLANKSASAPEEVVFHYQKSGGVNGTVMAHKQSDGTLAWQHTFPVNVASGNSSSPLLKRDTKNTPSTADDEDIVLMPLNTTDADAVNAPTSGVYALRENRPGGAGTAGNGTGQQIWFTPFPLDNTGTSRESVQRNGALSPDGSKLYLVTNSAQGKILTYDTATGALLNSVSVSFRLLEPSVGTDGRVYIGTLNGLLLVFNPDGTMNNSLFYSAGAEFTTSPVIARANGNDLIYLLKDADEIIALDHALQVRWNLKLAGKSYTALIVGKDAVNRHILYVGMNNSQIYAVEDRGDSGRILWNQAPGGTLWGGLTLKDGNLYASTLDGGDRQFISLKSIKVSAQNLPADAPWPKMGGNLRNSGQPHATAP